MSPMNPSGTSTFRVFSKVYVIVHYLPLTSKQQSHFRDGTLLNGEKCIHFGFEYSRQHRALTDEGLNRGRKGMMKYDDCAATDVTVSVHDY